MEEVTDQYLDLFPENLEPVPIYLCNNEELGYGNRLIVWTRKKLGGSNGGGEYCNLPLLKHIKVSRTIEEPKRTEVIKHEVNHYIDMNSKREPDKYDKIGAVMVLGVLVTGMASSVYENAIAVTGVFGLATFAVIFYNHFFVSEQRADKGTEFEDQSMDSKDIALLLVAMLATPLKMFSIYTNYWTQRGLFKSNLKKLFN